MKLCLYGQEQSHATPPYDLTQQAAQRHSLLNAPAQVNPTCNCKFWVHAQPQAEGPVLKGPSLELHLTL